MAISHLVRRADEAFVQSGVIEPSLPDSPWSFLLFILSVVGFTLAILVVSCDLLPYHLNQPGWLADKSSYRSVTPMVH